jgi:hypothetical protein
MPAEVGPQLSEKTEARDMPFPENTGGKDE